MNRILSAKAGSAMLLLGNEAIARGAIEAGVGVATTYPGTPASEIGDALASIAKDAGIYFEYSVNEMVATEIAIGAAASGVRALVSMKHVGLNVASDALLTFAYTGTRGGFVLVTADDPSCHSSQNEQDSRYYALLGGIPLLEPSSPQECYEMTREAFSISEKLELPVIVRTTTRVCHARAPVTVGEIEKRDVRKEFVKDPGRFVTVPAVARERHLVLLQRLIDAERLANESHLNRRERVGVGGKVGIVANSSAYNYVMDSMRAMGLSADVLKLGFSHPLPTRIIIDFMEDHETLVVVEELEPVLETSIRAVAQRHSCRSRILGKADGLFPRAHEFDQAVVAGGLAKALGGGTPFAGRNASMIDDLPARPPILCAGCPHSATYFAVNKAVGKNVVFASDIGCYTLGVAPPYNAADLLVCMGSSVGTAGGLAKVNQQPVIAFIGDSTFFHAGIPGLVNAVHYGHKFLLMILDNRTTAMTGHQPHPGSEKGPSCCDITAVSIEDLVKGCGVKWLKVVDPYDIKTTTEAVKQALKQDSVSVIVARRECALIAMRDQKGAISKKQAVDQDLCKKCRTCVDKFRCPAITSKDKVQRIDLALCAGCEVCAEVCPHKAIRSAE